MQIVFLRQAAEAEVKDEEVEISNGLAAAFLGRRLDTSDGSQKSGGASSKGSSERDESDTSDSEAERLEEEKEQQMKMGKEKPKEGGEGQGKEEEQKEKTEGVKGGEGEREEGDEVEEEEEEEEEEPFSTPVQILTVLPGDEVHYPREGDKVKVHYVGRTREGTVFDASRGRKDGREFTMRIGEGKVIHGWELGLVRMCLGQRAVLRIRYDYGYGVPGKGLVPPMADLEFDIELLQINDSRAQGPYAAERAGDRMYALENRVEELSKLRRKIKKSLPTAKA